MLRGPLVAELHERADRGRRGVEDRDAVLRDELPEAAGVRRHRRALVHEDGRAVEQGAVRHVAVAGDPADVGGAPVDVVLAQVEDHLRRPRGLRHVAAGRVEDALRLARRAARVEDEQRVLAVELLRGAVGGGFRRETVPPVVEAVLEIDLVVGALEHDDRGHGRARLHRLVDRVLEAQHRALAPAAVRRHDDLAAGVLDAVAQRVGGEPAEHDAVHGADARAREHRDRGLGHERHVDRDAVALSDAERLERVGEQADFAVELRVRERADLAGLAFPDERGFVAARPRQMAVERVVGEIGRSADEPLRVRRLPLESPAPRLEPVQLARGGGPEGLGRLRGGGRQFRARGLARNARGLGEGGGRGKGAAFLK